jgi:cytochrome c oxidase subunit II
MIRRMLSAFHRGGNSGPVLRRCVAGFLFIFCGGAWREAPLSTLNPAGPSAEAVAAVWWVMFWGAMAITLFMAVLGAYVILRKPERRRKVPARLLIIGGGVFFPLAVVTSLLVYGIVRAPALWSGAAPDDAFRVDVIGHRWWWEIRYPDKDGRLHDANEIHIPVNRPVLVHVTTDDVIHSFWVPRLAGKIDAIPGIVNRLRIKAERAGVYRGICAEFCGAQHARMGFLVEAHEEDELRARLDTLSARAVPDSTGPQAFQEHCAACHSLDSRTQSTSPGPNLAGLSERRYLGGGLIRNEDGAVRRWILDHHLLKPGNLMPAMDHLPGETVDEIAEFLEQRP